MTKLFHTVVAFGITLGAASLGCATPAEQDETVAAENELTTHGPTTDAFCDDTWPTTKGGSSGLPCLPPPPDPDAACRPLGNPFHCAPSTDGFTCKISIAKAKCVDPAGPAAPAWQCPSGQIPINQCECWAGEPGCEPPPPTP